MQIQLKQTLRVCITGLLTIFTIAWIVTVIGWPVCVFNIDHTCPDPKYPVLHVEKGSYEQGTTYWCLPDSRSDPTQVAAVDVPRVCDNAQGWMVAFFLFAFLDFLYVGPHGSCCFSMNVCRGCMMDVCARFRDKNTFLFF